VGRTRNSSCLQLLYYVASTAGIMLSFVALISERILRSVTGSEKNYMSEVVGMCSTGVIGLCLMSLALANKPSKMLLWVTLASYTSVAHSMWVAANPTEMFFGWKNAYRYSYDNNFEEAYISKQGGLGYAAYPFIMLITLDSVRLISLTLATTLPSLAVFVLLANVIKFQPFTCVEEPAKIRDRPSYILVTAGSLLLGVINLVLLPSYSYMVF